MSAPEDPDDWGPEVFHNVSDQEALETAQEAAPDLSPAEQKAWAKKMRGQQS